MTPWDFQVDAQEVVLQDVNIPSALIGYINANFIAAIVVGASTRNALMRKFKPPDVPTSLGKSAPEFCAVYVIAKGKVQSARSAIRPPMPASSTAPNSGTSTPRSSYATPRASMTTYGLRGSTPRLHTSIGPTTFHPNSSTDSEDLSRSRHNWKSEGSCSSLDRSSEETTLTGIFSGNASNPRLANSPDICARNAGNSYGRTSLSGNSDNLSNPSFYSTGMSSEMLDHSVQSGSSQSSQNSSSHELEAEMRKLKLELMQTMGLYQSLCKEADVASHRAEDLHELKPEEACNIEDVKLANEAALTVAELEKQRCKAATKAAKISQQLVGIETQKKNTAEAKAKRKEEERKRATESLAHNHTRYSRYTIQDIETATDYFSTSLKIGEGGYGPVYRAMLNHTPVAIKVLKSDVSQGFKQFQKEVDVLSCMRHPNMVLLLGACPEYGCLIYEYMENGSLEDRLFRKNNTPPIPWPIRFKIAAEIATALFFLHNAKPEPLVHRDLKPANILLDRNYVSKISDVGLARLVPPSVSNNITQYYMTAAAGTFCYIDPEYQQTGQLGVKSDVYSLGIMLLQIITARPAMGLTHIVERAIEKGTFPEILDPVIKEWPVEAALSFAQMALKCCELRKKDRPDLGSIVLPELIRIRDLEGDDPLQASSMPWLKGSSS
ncbi:hypothetical protein Nepgr_005614 [Nepenthes gracilis]|uniref:RING-type E3 ubiquitin transferase n=1 Tax=Nepenthes gracilis TaxID=150966 RepID=A0AAD3S3H5_NEPGR|nr:hypothetical protein Nepgr_005614 [Nepenthes gracilis]